MRSDHALQKAVLEQLDFDPAIDCAHIGVTAQEGVVTLSGHVHSIAEKRGAEVAAGSVKGVKAVVDNVAVELPGKCQTADEIVAIRAYARLSTNAAVPLERIHLAVEKGIITLRGDVDWHYQRAAAENDVQQLDCARGIRNEITLRPPVRPEVVREKIQEAFARIAPLDAKRIDVETKGTHVTLSGVVTSWHEKGLAENAVWSVPGVTGITDELTVI
jgi:osmotically-inducible protein OsmY